MLDPIVLHRGAPFCDTAVRIRIFLWLTREETGSSSHYLVHRHSWESPSRVLGVQEIALVAQLPQEDPTLSRALSQGALWWGPSITLARTWRHTNTGPVCVFVCFSSKTSHRVTGGYTTICSEYSNQNTTDIGLCRRRKGRNVVHRRASCSSLEGDPPPLGDDV